MCIRYIVDSLLHLLSTLSLSIIHPLILQAETDRIANEIQRKKEKEKQEFYEDKAKMVSIIISMQEFDSIKQNLFPLTLFLFHCVQHFSLLLQLFRFISFTSNYCRTVMEQSQETIIVSWSLM